MASKKTTTAENTVELRIPKVHGVLEDDVIIGVNGVNYQIPRGKTVNVPEYIKEEYERSENAKELLYQTAEARKYKELSVQESTSNSEVVD